MSFDNEMQLLLKSYYEAFSEKSLKTRFIFPTYQYIGNTINTLAYNQTQQMLSDDPNYQFKWNECHKLNENPQTFATVLFYGLEATLSKQQADKNDIGAFEKSVSETKDSIQKKNFNLESSLSNKMSIVKENNQKIVKRVLRIEDTLEKIHLNKNSYDRKNDAEIYSSNVIKNSNEKLHDLDNKVSDLKYFLETNIFSHKCSSNIEHLSKDSMFEYAYEIKSSKHGLSEKKDEASKKQEKGNFIYFAFNLIIYLEKDSNLLMNLKQIQELLENLRQKVDENKQEVEELKNLRVR